MLSDKVNSWKSCVADEDWKIAVCRRDLTKARETLAYLHHILIGGNKTETEMLSDISQLTGKQIADAIHSYTAVRTKAIPSAVF